MAEPKGRLIDVEALWRMERVGAVTLSPDGAQAVCAVTATRWRTTRGAPACGCCPPRRRAAPPHQRGEKDGQPAWSPTGRAIAFLAKREQEGTRTTRRPALRDRARRRRGAAISDFAPGIEAFKWFPDGRRIAFVSWVWPELKGTSAQAKRHKDLRSARKAPT